MRRALIICVAAVAIAGCGGQSARQKLVASCEAYGRQWAADYTAPYSSSISSAQLDALAQSAAQTCVDSGGPGR